MKLTAIVSTVLCLGAAHLVAADQTSTLTTTVTKTLVRVNAVTPTAAPTSSVPLIHTSTPVASSTLVPSTSAATSTAAPSDEPVHTGAAASFGGNMPVALAGGAVALLFGAL
ncbi:uncharacterized protein DSM5745_07547 [Aspergillus mulundensis]|uniref:GPI anchored protein n=1 Tax=Aspergillus mulundensis TaxID=1810919 RepID=A0A3D8RE93_9EURO|nr:Uncharacterized protein DSM5745_07547 [Aspergillus mulundensis]RDW72375.1 Uncharacterized protein DSM5745_07547 [Aspergillus mulundensis]